MCNVCFEKISEGETRFCSLDRPGIDICSKCYAKLSATTWEIYKPNEVFIAETQHQNVVKCEKVNDSSANKTLFNAFVQYKNRPCFGFKKTDTTYEWITYGQVLGKITSVAYGMADVQANSATKQVLWAICARNRLEWYLVDYAALMRSIVTAPIHYSLSNEDMEHIIENATCSAVVTGTQELTSVFVNAVEQGRCKSLQFIVQMDPQIAATSTKVTIMSFDDLVKRGDAYMTKNKINKDNTEQLKKTMLVAPKNESQLATLIYTSGSTGKPKGAMISDGAWNKSVHALMHSEQKIVFSFAPLAHMSDRKHVLISICNGCRIGVFQGKMQNIFEDFQIVKPHIVVSTPRLYNMLHSEFQKMVAEQVVEFEKTKGTSPDAKELASIERQMMEKFKPMLGGRVHMIVTGGSATSVAVKKFLVACFKCQLNDGYGATEAGGIMDNGSIKQDVQFKLFDVAEMGYTCNDKPYPRGELCVKTPTMFSGYFNNAELTEKALDKDGFLHTGDIVELQSANKVKIIDRIKNIFKLAQGEFVAPERLETVYQESAYIDQICIYGNPVRSYVLAVVIPNVKVLCDYLISKGKLEQGCAYNHETITPFLNDPTVHELLASEFQIYAKKEKLQLYEIPRAVLVDNDPFTIENTRLTSSLKLARPTVEKYYKERLEQMYSDMEQAETKQMKQDLKDLLHNITGKNAQSSDNIAQMGVDSLHAVKLVSLIKSKYKIDVPVSMIFKSNASLTELSDFIMNNSKTSKETNAISWDKEVTTALDETIDAKNCTESCSIPTNLATTNHVLLTGATGFLGTFLLRDLLDATSTQCKVHCIVRATSNEAALERLISSLKQFNLWKTEYNDKLVAHAGDVSKPLLGLNNDTFDTLSKQIEAIYHDAAVVNSIMSYEQLKPSNTSSVVEILRLASRNKLKAVHHVSTIGVVQGISSAAVMEQAPLYIHPFMDRIAGYSQSKLVAEQIVHLAACTRGIPCTIYRPGMIGCDSSSGICNQTDWVIRLLKGCQLLGCYPNTNERLLDWTPVNDVSNAIVQLSQKQDAYQFCMQGAFHLINKQNSVLIDTMFKIMKETTTPSLELLPYKQWQAKIKEQLEEMEKQGDSSSALYNALWPLPSLFRGDNFPSSGGEFDNVVTCSMLEKPNGFRTISGDIIAMALKQIH